MTIKPLIEQLAGYNRWANTRFVERLQTEPEALLDRPVASSFPTLRDTLLHIRDAENAWMHRLEGIAPVPWPAEQDRDIATLLTYSAKLEDLLRKADEAWLLSTAAYHDLRGNRHEQVRWQMVLHCFNHGTQHRGQVITMMRTLGLDSIPANDLIVFQRSHPSI
ncbi:MAG: DinB family protein [Flavobacteriales bacterium]|nr:DinB family protein [Flavobacteriales bacterium]